MKNPLYASQKNEKLTKAYIDAMHPQTCEERLTEAVQETFSPAQSQLWLRETVKAAGHHITSLNSMNMVQAKSVSLNELMFLGHLQRELDLSHVSKILMNFDSLQVQPARVFWSHTHQKYVVVDGQHTVISLWVIYTQIFQLPDTQQVPVAVFSGKLEDLGSDQVRTLFLSINNNAEKISEADWHRLYVINHRINHDTTPSAKKHAMIQNVVEAHDMFFTQEFKMDRHLPGALTRFSEWKTESEDVLIRFAEYMKHSGVAAKRAITVHEQDILMEFFRLHAIDNTTHWTEQDVRKVYHWASEAFHHDFVKHGTKWSNFPNSLYVKCKDAVHDWVDTDQDVAEHMRVSWSSDYYLMSVVLFTESLRAANLKVSLPSLTTMKSFARTKASGFWPNTHQLV